MLKKLAARTDSINMQIGHIVSWLSFVMVILMFITVAQRYLFQSNHIWMQELIEFMHAIMFMAVAGYTLLEDDHVRVDLLYEKMSERKKAIVNLCGSVFFLIPVCCALIYFSYNFVLSSWQIFEGSRENDGLSGVFLLKSFIWVFAITLLIQAFSTISNSLLFLRK